MAELEDADRAWAKIPKRTKRLPYQRQGHEPRVFDLRRELYRIFGVDLTNVPGISAMTSQTILCEVGTDVSRFRNASAFASWLGLCPEKKISGGKVLFTKSRRVRSRVAIALRLAARLYIMPKTTWESSSAGFAASSGNLKLLQLQLTSLPESSTTCSAHERHTTNPCSTSAKRRR
jgi:transposase